MKTCLKMRLTKMYQRCLQADQLLVWTVLDQENMDFSWLLMQKVHYSKYFVNIVSKKKIQ